MTTEVIAYSQFAALNIRIGTIVAAEPVPEADRLLRLLVNVGETDESGAAVHRQIISGIREFFPDPSVLLGRQCPFLVNLEPRTIRGYESQGMILAGGNGETFTLLHPAHEVPPGTPVS
jgi:methionyl-tRNA synthetase